MLYLFIKALMSVWVMYYPNFFGDFVSFEIPKWILSSVLSIYKMRIKQFDCGAIDLHCIMVWPCMASCSAAIDQFLTAVIGVFNWQYVPSEVYCIRALLYSSTTVDFHPLKNKVKVTFIEHDPCCYKGRGKQGGNSHENSPLHH